MTPTDRVTRVFFERFKNGVLSLDLLPPDTDGVVWVRLRYTLSIGGTYKTQARTETFTIESALGSWQRANALDAVQRVLVTKTKSMHTRSTLSRHILHRVRPWLVDNGHRLIDALRPHLSHTRESS